MNSIESLRLDFNSQIRQLYNIHNRKLFDECIYVGSGDSYVAGLIAEYLTDHKCRCHSPSDLFNSKFIKNKTYCFISVSGKTMANIEIARRVSEAGNKTIAVTLNKKSDLAQICDEVILPDIKRTETPTAGFGTFVSNLVTCLQIAGLVIPQKFDTWYNNGVQLSHSLIESFTIPKETLFLLGNSTLYAVAFYASLQMAEFFGSPAFAQKLEEFCHSPIFGLPKSHQIWILGQSDYKTSRRLGELGLRLSYIELYNKDVFAQLFEAIFCLQSLILLLAQRNHCTELQYIKMKDVLKASSDIIYGQLD